MISRLIPVIVFTLCLFGHGSSRFACLDQVCADDNAVESAATSTVAAAEGAVDVAERTLVPGSIDELVRRSESKPVTMAIAEDMRRLFMEVPRDADDLKAMQAHYQALYQRVMPCTVAVLLRSGMGSGVVISEDGYVLTAGHVAGRAGRDVTFIFPDGRSVKGKSLGANYGIDSGLLKITTPGKWPYAEVGHSARLKGGQWCLATGHPGGYQSGRSPPLRVGRIFMQRPIVIVTDCTLVGGDSGGPLFDVQGKIIGIHSRIGDETRTNLHTPIDTYRSTWRRLVAGESWGGRQPGGPYIGVYETAKSTTARIGKVLDGSAADKAGIKVGDVVLKFGDKPIADFAALVAVVGETDPGDRVEVKIQRSTQTMILNVTIGRYLP